MSIIQDYKKICLAVNRNTDHNSYKKSLTFIEKFVLILEDRKFYYHPGFDIFSILRAAIRRVQKRAITGGASTVEQQFVRAITNRREKTIFRKIREILLAIFISKKYEKNVILRAYLKIAYLGYNFKGLYQVAHVIYNTNIKNLDYTQSSYIASMLKYPVPSNPYPSWKEKINKRSEYAIYILESHKGFFVKSIKNL